MPRRGPRIFGGIVLFGLLGAVAFWTHEPDPLEEAHAFLAPFKLAWGDSRPSHYEELVQQAAFERRAYLRDEEDRMIHLLDPAHGWTLTRPGSYPLATITASFEGVSSRAKFLADLPLVGRFFPAQPYRISIDLSPEKRTNGAEEASQAFSSGVGWTRAVVNVGGRDFGAGAFRDGGERSALTPTSPGPGVHAIEPGT